jgi:hypothetical protein
LTGGCAPFAFGDLVDSGCLARGRLRLENLRFAKLHRWAKLLSVAAGRESQFR